MKFLVLSVALLLTLVGCIKNNPAPSYIEVKEFILEENPAGNNAGVLTQNFSDAWIYINNDLVGVFELPCKVPVLVSGSATIRVAPAILNNGISATKKIYPFTEAYTEEIVLVQNDVVSVQPKTRYASNAKFWIEDFESATIAMNSGNPSPASITLAGDVNNTYGQVILNSSQNEWAAYTNQALSFPAGKEVYLEVDYRNTTKLVTGMISLKSDGSQESHVNIAMNAQGPATAVWKKIYIDLTEIVGYSGGIEFLQTFNAKLGDDQSEAEILIDNIKVVYF